MANELEDKRKELIEQLTTEILLNIHKTVSELMTQILVKSVEDEDSIAKRQFPIDYNPNWAIAEKRFPKNKKSAELFLSQSAEGRPRLRKIIDNIITNNEMEIEKKAKEKTNKNQV